MNFPKISRIEYVKYLNEIGSTFEDCVYMTVPSRGKHLSEKALVKALEENRYGDILRKYDSIAFEVGYNEWIRR